MTVGAGPTPNANTAPDEEHIERHGSWSPANHYDCRLADQGSWVPVGGAPTKVDRLGYKPAIPAWGLVRSAECLSTTRPRRVTPFFTRLDATRNHVSRSAPVAAGGMLG